LTEHILGKLGNGGCEAGFEAVTENVGA